MAIIFKTVPGHERYQVSNMESLKDTVTDKIEIFRCKGRIEVTLLNNDESIKIRLSELVARTFIDNPNDLPYVEIIKGKWNLPAFLRWTSELWLPVPNFSRYEISNKERIKRVESGKITEYKDYGMNTLGLTTDENKGVNKTFNSLVAMTHIPNPDNLPIAMHINGLSNRPENLKWARNGDQKKKGERPNGQIIVPVERLDLKTLKVLQTYENKKNIFAWIRENCRTEATDETLNATIGQVCTGSKNSAYGYAWKYQFIEIEGEVWKKHPDKKYKDFKFSTEGRCRSQFKLLLGTVNSAGYIRIFDGIFLHILIAETHIPNPEKKPFIDHINKNRSDNRVSNLRWVTAKENTKHSKDIIIYQYSMDKKTFIKKYESISTAAEENDIPTSSISRCAKGNGDSAGGYYWSYTELELK